MAPKMFLHQKTATVGKILLHWEYNDTVTFRTSQQYRVKLSVHTPYIPAISFLGMCPTEISIYTFQRHLQEFNSTVYNSPKV